MCLSFSAEVHNFFIIMWQQNPHLTHHVTSLPSGRSCDGLELSCDKPCDIACDKITEKVISRMEFHYFTWLSWLRSKWIELSSFVCHTSHCHKSHMIRNWHIIVKAGKANDVEVTWPCSTGSSTYWRLFLLRSNRRYHPSTARGYPTLFKTIQICLQRNSYPITKNNRYRPKYI